MSILSKTRWTIRLGAALALSCGIWQTAYSQERGYGFHEREFHGGGVPQREFRDREYPDHELPGREFRDHERGHEFPDARFLDSRYHHDHYYPPVGLVFGALPPGYRRIYSPDGDFYFAGGVWYRAYGPGRYFVVAPPIGIAVPVLPPYYTTVLVGGVPYYYANNTYYLQAPGGYLVADAPPNSAVVELPPSTSTGQPPAPNSVIELPRG